MPKDTSTAERCYLFATNLQRLMDQHHLTVRETAKKAGITDLKRFYRWASKGISRATHEHDADLEKLKTLFGLKSLKQLWPEADEATAVTCLSDKLRAAGKIDFDYETAFKMLVVLRGVDVDEAFHFRTQIDEWFQQVTETRTVQEILEPKTGAQIVSFIEINYPEAFEVVMRRQFGGREQLVTTLDAAILRNGGANGLCKKVVERAFKQMRSGIK